MKRKGAELATMCDKFRHGWVVEYTWDDILGMDPHRLAIDAIELKEDS